MLLKPVLLTPREQIEVRRARALAKLETANGEYAAELQADIAWLERLLANLTAKHSPSSIAQACEPWDTL